MNYYTLFNYFWRIKRLEHSFTPNEIAVYHALADHCNLLGWKNPFNLSVDELRVKTGIKTKEPLDTARNKLKQYGLLDYKNGQGRGNTTQYFLVLPPGCEDDEGEKGDKKGMKNTPFSPPFSSPFSPPFSPPETTTVHKKKTKPKRKEGANAPPVGEVELSAEEKEFQWVGDNTPRVLEMKKPLTAEQYRACCSKFSKAVVQDVLQGMENHAKLLTAYLSASLTLQDWCKRRAGPLQGNTRTASVNATTATGSINQKVADQRKTKPT
ncbi:hypothetical protein [Hymenobacter guriensis]|uniref:Helix-turn-helix domain-containing protein n=1 Tax=Hymenobacter guriensis TaxID=2793065 RepID=A0ABS0L9G6_9BACT|nr:hypothetical protein [Hymenobacter guriensis]MBG8556184.1 hypothetical protein [Hymenobacter guriensis]